MPSSVILIFVVIYAFAALLMVTLHYAYVSERSDDYKIYPYKPRRLTFMARARNIGGNMAMSGAGLVLVAVFLPERLFDTGEASVVRIVGETLGVLAIYDFGYYFLHRYAFHEWKWMSKVHVMHHTNKKPTVAESLFAHPLEIGLGVVLFILSMLIVGPITPLAFAGSFAVFTLFNLLIHSGLDFRHPLLRPFAYLARKHARHHASMRAGNYASISPLPDIVFGTAE
ncbi:hypothetical protein PPSIR1_22079 [Plesiocystis pacifica SIR-1]|uniref:Fatty acid hydroxylase domain-containing protein n=1 Tax=Plesiocystis pacifica SIR-1 TaxID=391625 RepID=A6FXR3_9BACT|nr:sterol desaturase family protein [Plesiocystis pacifica]EDM81651.1 hypothetical protein PPSIR1_22079 [Plesiocystis pacifica SIR-1]